MPPIRLSAPDWCFAGSLEPAAYYRMLADLGIDAAEMVAPERRAAARAAGLKLINLCAHPIERGLNRREHHADLVPAVRAAIREAVAEGIAQLIVFSGNRAGQADAEGIDHCAAALRALAPAAEDAGVVLAFEVLNSFEHADYAADSSRYGLEVVRRVASPAVKLLCDLYHLRRMGEALPEVATRNLAHIAHIHLAQAPSRTRLDEGNERADGIDHARVVPAIVAAGYAGWWGLEFVPRGDAQSELAASAAALRAWTAAGPPPP
jgi:hydroxypyruvate isomerase